MKIINITTQQEFDNIVNGIINNKMYFAHRDFDDAMAKIYIKETIPQYTFIKTYEDVSTFELEQEKEKKLINALIEYGSFKDISEKQIHVMLEDAFKNKFIEMIKKDIENDVAVLDKAPLVYPEHYINLLDNKDIIAHLKLIINKETTHHSPLYFYALKENNEDLVVSLMDMKLIPLNKPTVDLLLKDISKNGIVVDKYIKELNIFNELLIVNYKSLSVFLDKSWKKSIIDNEIMCNDMSSDCLLYKLQEEEISNDYTFELIKSIVKNEREKSMTYYQNRLFLNVLQKNALIHNDEKVINYLLNNEKEFKDQRFISSGSFMIFLMKKYEKDEINLFKKALDINTFNINQKIGDSNLMSIAIRDSLVKSVSMLIELGADLEFSDNDIKKPINLLKVCLKKAKQGKSGFDLDKLKMIEISFERTLLIKQIGLNNLSPAENLKKRL